MPISNESTAPESTASETAPRAESEAPPPARRARRRRALGRSYRGVSAAEQEMILQAAVAEAEASREPIERPAEEIRAEPNAAATERQEEPADAPAPAAAEAKPPKLESETSAPSFWSFGRHDPAGKKSRAVDGWAWRW